MTPRIHQHAVRWSSQRRPYTQLVPHRAADNEESGFFARHVCYISFQGIGRGIFLKDIVL